ncbi:uncharacterized protein LOC125824223 [Solanum verrucosum]|uniref:uncharacterized protein LOC125824223 n=1 Tax=Solanum verrucosum TaxID=315347 RepID=UPI0020D09C42|nr:uncharacterized protein LOC125824223 [Solanum verrucosum]
MVADSRAGMSKFISSVSEMVVKECRTTMLINDMDISRLMGHAQQIEKEKLKEKSRELKRAKTGVGNFSHARSDIHGRRRFRSSCTKCGMKNESKCLAGIDGCFGSGKSGHKMRDCPMLMAKGREGKKASPSGVGANAPKQNRFYALQTRDEKEGFPNVVTGSDSQGHQFRG